MKSEIIKEILKSSAPFLKYKLYINKLNNDDLVSLLYSAACDEHFKIVKDIIENHLNESLDNSIGIKHIIKIIIKHGDAKLFEKAIGRFKAVHICNSRDGYFLRLAAYYNNIEILNFLIEKCSKEVDINTTQVLRVAVLNNNFDAVKYLLNVEGIRVDIGHCEMIKASIKNEYYKILEILLNHETVDFKYLNLWVNECLNNSNSWIYEDKHKKRLLELKANKPDLFQKLTQGA